MSPPVPMLLDDDDVARMRRENAVLVDRTALGTVLEWADKEFTGPDVMAALRELRAALKPPEPVVVIQKRRTGR